MSNQNFVQIYAADAKRGKAYASESRLAQWIGLVISDWMIKWRVFLSESCSAVKYTMMQNHSKCVGMSVVSPTSRFAYTFRLHDRSRFAYTLNILRT